MLLLKNSILFLTTLIALGRAAGEEGPVVVLPAGALRGVSRSDGTDAFLGVPFAEPPVGPLRWADPVPTPKWGGVRNATTFSAGCIQHCELPPHTCPEVIDEDCLYLNVFRPSNTTAGPLPVMFFIPGGRFLQGSAMSKLYDGGELARVNEAVVVVINYRLGSLGFLAVDAKGADGLPSGNYGLRDQLTALRWVQTNAAALGGDPSRVLLFGQSAGGTSTSVLLTSPHAKGLFSSALIESNPWTLHVRDAHEAVAIGKDFAKDVGCKHDDGSRLANCLRAATTDAIIAAQKAASNVIDPLYPILLFYPWTPTVDGDLVLGQPLELMAEGKFTRVPVALGTVRDEGLLFINQADGKPLPYDKYLLLLAAIFHVHAPAVAEMYPVPDSMRNDTRPIVSTLTTDYIFLCPARKAARAVVSHGQPAWLYRYDHVASFNAHIWGPLYPYCAKDVVCHGSELLFLFDTASAGGLTMTPAESAMSESIGKMWANMARAPAGGPSPAGSGLPDWPGYDAKTDTNIVIDIPFTTQAALRSEFCDMFDKIGYKY